jgi:hypothetical protein
MPRWSVHAVAAFVGLALAACGGVGPPGPGREDVLFLRSSRGVTLVHPQGEGIAVLLPGAVPSTDWSAVVRAVPHGEATEVVAFDPLSGDRLWSRQVTGRLEVKVASDQGRHVVLGSPADDSGYPRGRSTTTLVVVSEDTPEPRTIELQGNFEPEAFSTDGQSLFVVEYLPPKRPTSYRVRRLDLQTKQVGGVYTVDAELQEAMQGTARIQAASPDGRRLYTLYTIDGADGDRHAFVHVLSLEEEWAHCVDLPPAFATAPERSIAISVAPDGGRLWVVDASTGTVAEVNTETLAVTRTTEAAFGSQGGAAYAVGGTDGKLYLAKGTDLLAVDASTLAPGREWDFDARITGLQAASDGSRLYVGLRDEIVILDTRTGEKVGVLDPANLDSLGQLGQTIRPLQEDRTAVECAC